VLHALSISSFLHVIIVIVLRVAANIFNKQQRTCDKGRSSGLGVGSGAKSARSMKQLTIKIDKLSVKFFTGNDTKFQGQDEYEGRNGRFQSLPKLKMAYELRYKTGGRLMKYVSYSEFPFFELSLQRR
jgi:hypothetical protein